MQVRFRPIADIAAVTKHCDVMTRLPKESVLRIAMGFILLALVCGAAYLWFAEGEPPTGLVMLLSAATLAVGWTIRRLEARNAANSKRPPSTQTGHSAQVRIRPIADIHSATARLNFGNAECVWNRVAAFVARVDPAPWALNRSRLTSRSLSCHRKRC